MNRYTIMASLFALFFRIAAPKECLLMADDIESEQASAIAVIESVLRLSDSPHAMAQQILADAAIEIRRNVPENVEIAELFEAVENMKFSDEKASVTRWKSSLKEALTILKFEPLMEAPMPDGFPKPAHVGEIRVQAYPSYRLAKTKMTLIEGAAFWTLFNHIKQEEIAMTSPVEMTFKTGRDESLSKASMAFMYRSTAQGTSGTSGRVDVVDVPAELSVSIGVRGKTTDKRVLEAKRRLEKWLAEHKAEYESVGSLRVMGYNSPFVPDAKQFSEVQIPVRLVQGAVRVQGLSQ